MSKLLKNLYNENYIEALSRGLKSVYNSFDENSFFNAIFNEEWKNKELKERMRAISCTIGEFLPFDYAQSVDILKKVFVNIDKKYSLENMVFQDFVAVYGLEYFSVSMSALEVFTVKSSSEFAIREFILKYKTQTMSQIKLWAKSKNEHVRRLASEGCRPRLPWAKILTDFISNPSDVLEVLELLKDDKSAYVRKSVANNINDISKDNPQIVKVVLKKWFGISKNTDALLKHGCRTMLKNGDSEVLTIFGFIQRADIHVESFSVSQSVEMEKTLEFSFTISSKKSLGRLRVEYIMWFLRANKSYSKKIFKICEGTYDAVSKNIIKKHSFKTITTRKYYKGKQKIAIVINGKMFSIKEFSLV